MAQTRLHLCSFSLPGPKRPERRPLMRKYTLADKNAKANIDLTDYSDIIANAVLDVMDNVDDVTVLVEKDCYYVSPTP